ncbi:MAG: LysR family transcriptional regulator [Eubacteriales bacterium]|nr:LysR family transcriptional regulator [Eubacteriales bacterium]
MAVTYDYYRIFYFVAKYRSFTRAAHILMNSQPNITRAMNNLEQELGCTLFLRSNRGVTLTPEGEKLFAHVQIAQEQLQAAEDELASDKTLSKGAVSLGVSEIALHCLLLPILREFHLAYPGVHLRLTNCSAPQAIAAVKSGRVEFAVVTMPEGVDKTLRDISLVRFRDVLVAGPQFLELKGKTLCLADLAEYPVICLGRDTRTYEFYNQFFAEHGLVLQPDIEVATSDQILPLVKNDLGLGFLPGDLAMEAIGKGEVFEVKLSERIPTREICMVWDPKRPIGVAARELEKMIRTAAKAASEE